MKRVRVLIFFLILFLTGCAEKESKISQEVNPESQKQAIMFENEKYALSIHSIDGWSKKEELKEPFNVSFVNGKATAIISVLETRKSIEEIKEEIIIGAGKVTMIDEGDKHLTFRSDRTESIRTDVFVEQKDIQTRLLIFMTPLNQYETNKEKFDAFKQKIHFE